MSTESLFTTMAGLQAISANMQAVASNLSNAATTGYLAVQVATEAAPYTGPNAPGGADAVALTPNPDTAAGPVTQTGDPLDVAIGGDAWMQVQTDSGVALTRNGSLQVTTAGILADSAGNPVLSTSGEPISVPQVNRLVIGADGTVSGVLAGQAGATPQKFGQINLVATPSGILTPLSGTLFLAAGTAAQPAINGSLHQGYLNQSNVDPTQSMMDLINDSRSYQLQTTMLKTQSDNNSALNTLLAQG
jgi:flagellar basal-body rod protein FlgF